MNYQQIGGERADLDSEQLGVEHAFKFKEEAGEMSREALEKLAKAIVDGEAEEDEMRDIAEEFGIEWDEDVMALADKIAQEIENRDRTEFEI